MRGILASCALSLLLLAAAWADHHQDHHHHHDGDGAAHSHEGEMSCHKLAAPNADFGFALYKSLSTNAAAGKNIFFSPLGISTALSMLSTGAKGETHRQMFASLGYTSLNQMQANDAYSPLEAFLKDVKHSYSAHVFNVDFTKPEEAAAEINTHIAAKTNDKIKDMVKDLSPEMAMVLINYVYFRGRWVKPFDANNTAKADFDVDETTKVQVDMMKRNGRYDFYHDSDNHTTVILLPYHGNTSMMIVLPDEGKMKEVEGYITKEHIRHWHDSLFRSSVNLFLPKFSISAEATLDSTLKEMGMVDAFTDNADFSGLSDAVKLKVSKVSHQAMLSVDETGTEAVAATTIEVMPMSMPEVMNLNRPFMVFILEHSTKSILFMGKISDPTAM
uniref:Serpin peptidase inhibitor, clade A (alpha-1 antiproteinase, antitrypsin), member 1 n=1 Tax=Gasterosteus aculeatus aculeatus TaxID=481459 RepID=G3NMQ1_GASAC